MKVSQTTKINSTPEVEQTIFFFYLKKSKTKTQKERCKNKATHLTIPTYKFFFLQELGAKMVFPVFSLFNFIYTHNIQMTYLSSLFSLPWALFCQWILTLGWDCIHLVVGETLREIFNLAMMGGHRVCTTVKIKRLPKGKNE